MANAILSPRYVEILRRLSQMYFCYEYPERFQFNPLQCKHLCDALVRLPALLFVLDDKYPNAWKEIYRVVSEAEIYLHHCSSGEWPIEFLPRLTTGEAYSLHLHDLALFRLLLGVILKTDTGEICRKICHFYEEMGRFMKVRYDYADEMQLIKTYEQFAKRSIHAPQHKYIVEVSKFLGRKLKATFPTEVKSAGADSPIPTWLKIDPADLVLKIERGAIGEGSFGHVYEGSWLGLRVAAKEMPMDALDVFETEASVLAKLQSPFIVHLIGTCIKDSRLYLVMELVSSNLEQLLQDRSKRNRPPLLLPVAVDIMLQISRAMEYLHSQEIMHLDLKASNVLFELSSAPESREEGYGRVKLCDFGTATTRLFSFRAPDPKGTCYWRAPEVFPRSYEDVSAETTTPETYTGKADVYSFAMTCYEILTGKQPFAGVLPRELHLRIVNGERPTLKPSICPFILANYLQQCWDTDPGHRPCFEAVSKFLRKLKLCMLNSSLDWKDALDHGFLGVGFVESDKKSIFYEKLQIWKDKNLVAMHSRLDEMLFIWRFLTFEMRKEIAIDIASFLERIHGNPASGALSTGALYLCLDSSTIYIDWNLKPIFSGAASVIPLGHRQAKLLEEVRNIQDFGRILIELSTGCTWKDMPFSIASIQTWRDYSQLAFIDRQLVEEMGERQSWEVMRWFKLGLWCLSKSLLQEPDIHTVLQLLKEVAPRDSTLRIYLSSIPTIEKVID